MVKPDYNRDYYADLELSGPVDIAEVKKQFKKLALKWHPDRNPGKEEEAKEKFLVIQAAHEILTDPNTKAKYDAHVQRIPKPAASGVRGNPWQNMAQEVNQKFGVPPRRPMPPRPPAPTAAASTKHWDWAHKAKSKTDNLRANMEAWERARPQSKPSQPSTSASAASARPPKPPHREPPTPRTASQARRQEAAFGYRKSGYAPTSPEGDEPPVKNQHYNTNTGTDAAEASKSTPKSADEDPLFGETFLDGRQRTPYAANVGEKTDPFEPLNINRAKSVRDGSRRFPDDAGETPPTPPPRQRSASTGAENIRRPTDETPRPGEQSATNGFQYRSQPGARYGPREPNHTNSAPATASFPGPNNSTSSVNSSTNATVNGGASDPSKHGSNFSSAPGDGKATAAQQTRFTRTSADNINTSFVAEEKDGFNFQFSAGAEGSGDDSFLRAKQRARGGGHQSPLRKEFAPPAEPVGGADTSNGTQHAEPAKKQGDFVPEQWKEAFGPHIFVPPQSGKGASSPTRPIRPIKKSRSVRATAGTAAMVDEEETSGEDKSKAQTPASGVNGSRSPNAMDIDTPPPEPAGPQAGATRNVNVEPTKPEWRPGNGAAAEPRLGAGLKPTPAGSEDAEDFARPLFSELRNVEPLASPKATGLGSFADLSSTLPFPSRPSAKIPLGDQADKPPVKVDVPSPPSAPRPPAGLCGPAARVTPSVWLNYVSEFKAYMRSWCEYNKRMTDHFATRQRHHEGNGLDWIGTRGAAGSESYLRALEVDKIVRQKWTAACETHELHFKEYLAAWEKFWGGS
ncbi:hypothetical protein VTH06DRAFT_4135 [Thermothelomyces fergusii]